MPHALSHVRRHLGAHRRGGPEAGRRKVGSRHADGPPRSMDLPVRRDHDTLSQPLSLGRAGPWAPWIAVATPWSSDGVRESPKA